MVFSDSDILPYGVSLYKYDTCNAKLIMEGRICMSIPLWCHFIRALWCAVITHLLIVHHILCYWDGQCYQPSNSLVIQLRWHTAHISENASVSIQS